MGGQPGTTMETLHFQPWSLGAGVSRAWGHLREIPAGRVTTFLTWMGDMERCLRQRIKGIQLLKYISPLLLLPLVTHFPRTDQELYCQRSFCGVDIIILMSPAERKKGLLAHSLTSQGQEASNHSQEDKHLGSAEGKEREDERDHQDDEATEEHGGSCLSPRYKKETAISKTDKPNLKVTYQSINGFFFFFLLIVFGWKNRFS